MMKIYKTLADVKAGTLFTVYNLLGDVYVLTNRYIIDNEVPNRKIHECIRLRDGESKRFSEIIPIYELTVVKEKLVED